MRQKVLLVSSGGGHAVQARLLKPAFKDHELIHVIAGDAQGDLPDCSISNLWRVPACFQIASRLIRSAGADLVISTGALPGLIAIIAARVQGQTTIWIDSVANAKTLSLSGKVARVVAHKTYSQWPDVARRERVRFAGAVL